MKSAYKWRITNTKYVYITDEHNYGPFIYDKATHIREYEGGIEESVTNDGLIADVVSELTLEEYTERFNQMKNLTETDEEASRVKFLDVSYYYDFNNDECVVKATEAECEGYAPVINVETESLPSDQEPTAEVKVVYSDVDKTVHYEVKLGIPKGEKGEQGGAGTGSTVQISMDPKESVIEEYKNAAHLQYIEASDDPANLYSTLHIAPVLNKNVIDEQSCVKDGQEVSVVETAKLFIDYDDVEAKNNFKMGGNTTIGGNLTTNGTSTLNGATVINSTLNVTNQITGGNGLTITNGGANINGNTTISQNLTVGGNTTVQNLTVQDITVGGDVHFSETTMQTLTNDLSCPIGTIVMWPTLTAPDGWISCNGAHISVRMAEPSDTNVFVNNAYRYRHLIGKEWKTTGGQKSITMVDFVSPFPYVNLQSTILTTCFCNIKYIKNDTQYVVYNTTNISYKVEYQQTTPLIRFYFTDDDNNTYSLTISSGERLDMIQNNFVIQDTNNYKYNKICELLPVRFDNSTNNIYVGFPDFNNRFPTLKQGGILTSGGTETVTLQQTNLPPHRHKIVTGSTTDTSIVVSENGNHTHTFTVYSGSGNNGFPENTPWSSDYSSWESPATNPAGSHKHNISGVTQDNDNNNNLKSIPFSILPPYLSINFIMKYN